MKKFIPMALLASLAFGFQACKKDDDDVVTADGDNAQDQIYTENLDANKPLLVVYGDSISTGVLANTTLGQNPDNSLALQLVDYVKEQEFNATGFQEKLSNLDLAAASTVEPYGVRASVATQSSVTPQEIGLISFAKFGAKARDLEAMFNRWKVENTDTIQKKPEYIFVMLGGNDFCSDFTVDEILKDYVDGTNAIHQDAPDAELIIAPAPPVNQLAAIDFTYGPALQGLTGEEMTCRKFRENLCGRANEDANAVLTRIQAINTGIQAQATALAAAGAKVKFVDGILNWQIKPEELAVDCFHPSVAGQQIIGNFVKEAIAK